MVNENTMTVARALTELKLLDKRIRKETNNLEPVVAVKNSSEKIDGVLTKQEFAEETKSSYQKVTDLIDRRNKVKSAIVDSNSKTTVNVSGKKMTRAEAIERKNSIDYEIGLLDRLKSTYYSAVTDQEARNAEVDRRLHSLLESSLSGESNSKSSEDDIDNISKPFIRQNEVVLLDPLDIKDKIEELEEDIDGFMSEVDFVLSESNVITNITIE